MKEIPLTKGYVALVDDEDHADLSRYNWRAVVRRNTVYALRTSFQRFGPRRSIKMHRQILGLSPGQKPDVDHIDGDGLNNTRKNLRPASLSQNGANQRPQRGKSSRFKGVRRKGGRWVAEIRIDKARRALGYFVSEEEAARAYDSAARAAFGVYARLNLPPDAGGGTGEGGEAQR